MPRPIDISLPLGLTTPLFPGDPPLELEPEILGGAQITRLSFGSHTGTHLDAPRHVLPGGAGIDQIDLGLLIGPVRVLDLRSVRGRIGPKEFSDLGDTERLLLRTGQLGCAAFSEENPCLTPEAARALKESTRVRLLGIDALSFEPEGAGLEVHRVLLGGERPIWILEGLDLSAVQAGDYTLLCLPLCLEGGDGAPARAVLLPRG